MVKADVNLSVNGRQYSATIESRLLLVDFLRHELGFMGTHIGCEHGVCGACTILLNGVTARSCLEFAVSADGSDIRTVEDMAGLEMLHPIQEAFHEHHALQCGYCTPGFLMTTLELLAENPNPDEVAIRRALTNNLCRCTGYVNIVKAVASAAKKINQQNAT